MAEKNKSKLTPFQEQLRDTYKKVMEYKEAAEARTVSILYKFPEELYNISLKPDDFNENIWKVYFQIAHDIILIENKNTLDEMTVGLYLEQHPKLKAKYDEYGGFSLIEDSKAYAKLEALNGYIAELKKWKAVIELARRGFPVGDKLSSYVDMTAEQIYNELEAYLNHTFLNVESDIHSYDISDGIDQLIEDLDAGTAKGLPYHNLDILSNEVGGQYMGSITLVGGLSNVGKSSFARNAVIPSIIEHKEKIVIMLNEDGLAKWQREMLVFICNNILKYDIQKYTVRDGGYTKEIKSKLKEAADWLKEHTKNHTIIIVPFQQYQTSKAIKVIKKYASMGVKYFLLDTFKMDAGTVDNNSWAKMQQAMVDINDIVKPEALNIHILITFQLNKGSVKQRHYTQDNIGLAKNIIDVASTCIMIRDLYEDEYDGEGRAVKVWALEGKTKLEQHLNDTKKRYQILFIVKNREGAANKDQIVVETDLSRNVVKEVGICTIMPDTF